MMTKQNRVLGRFSYLVIDLGLSIIYLEDQAIVKLYDFIEVKVAKNYRIVLMYVACGLIAYKTLVSNIYTNIRSMWD